MIQHLLFHAHAGVGHRHHHVRARHQAAAVLQAELLLQDRLVGGQGQGAAPRHGVAGVYGRGVHQHALKPAWIALHGGAGRFQLGRRISMRLSSA